MIDQRNQLAPCFGLGLYQEEGAGEAVDLQGFEVEDRRSEGVGYGVYGQWKYGAAEIVGRIGDEIVKKRRRKGLPLQ